MIRHTINGKVFKCNKCNTIHVEYKNLLFSFNKNEFEKFANYLDTIDGREWENINRNSFLKRKIVIPISNTNAQIILTNEELNELRFLLNNSLKFGECQETIKLGNIEFVNNLN